MTNIKIRSFSKDWHNIWPEIATNDNFMFSAKFINGTFIVKIFPRWKLKITYLSVPWPVMIVL